MSIDRAPLAVETMIADHVAVSFQRNAVAPKVETTASQIRSRITDQFEHAKPGSEQDNRPPAAHRIAQPHHRNFRDRFAKSLCLMSGLRLLKACSSHWNGFVARIHLRRAAIPSTCSCFLRGSSLP